MMILAHLSMVSEFDVKVMQGLIQKSAAYLGRTRPNPVVGAACYDGETCLTEAFHERAGEAHAERRVLSLLGTRAKGMTLYVTLEPCSHTGKTPPCSEKVLRSGIRRLVIGCSDPNPKNKETIEAYKAAGIEVVYDVCKAQAQRLNLGFMSTQIRKRPYVRLKVATSLDGFMAASSGESLYFTNERSRREVHLQRRSSDVILVGAGTVLTDDPALNVRYGYLTEGFRNPVKLILDPHAQLTPDLAVFESNKDTKVILFSTKAYAVSFPDFVKGVRLPDGDHRVHWAFLMDWCYRCHIQTVYIEGGQSVYQSAMDAGVVDEWIQYVAPKPIKEGLKPLLDGEEGLKLTDFRMSKVGDDLKIRGFVSSLDWLV